MHPNALTPALAPALRHARRSHTPRRARWPPATVSANFSPMPLAVSACVICCNEADKIGLCLDSLAWCQDIVVLDSGSTDATVVLAQNHPSRPRVLTHAWQGYSLQRYFAAQQCRNPWVLMLDADEECSPQLAQEIQNLNEQISRTVAIYRMPRYNYINRRYVRCWSPDYQDRLVHRQRLQWAPESIPEVRRPAPGFSTARLRRPLLHNRLQPLRLEDFNDGPVMAERAKLLATTMAGNGQRAGVANLLVRPAATFIKYYFLRRAFLDGRFGLLVAYKTTIGVMLKYSALYALEETNLTGGDAAPAPSAESSHDAAPAVVASDRPVEPG